MSKESITSPATSDNSYTPKLIFIHNSISVTLEGIKQDKVSFTHRNVVNVFIVYGLDTRWVDLNIDFTWKDC